MTEYTPSNENLRDAWRAVRVGRSWDEANAEFRRWLAAHDQGVRDAVEPPEMTAKEHMEAAFEAAFPVPEGRDVPVGVPLIERFANGEIWVHTTGWASGAYDPIEVRTLEPLPPLIPDDCTAVWASTRGDESRRVWVRATGLMGDLADVWDDGNNNADYADGSDLIDPVPVPEEER